MAPSTALRSHCADSMIFRSCVPSSAGTWDRERPVRRCGRRLSPRARRAGRLPAIVPCRDLPRVREVHQRPSHDLERVGRLGAGRRAPRRVGPGRHRRRAAVASEPFERDRTARAVAREAGGERAVLLRHPKGPSTTAVWTWKPQCSHVNMPAAWSSSNSSSRTNCCSTARRDASVDRAVSCGECPVSLSDAILSRDHVGGRESCVVQVHRRRARPVARVAAPACRMLRACGPVDNCSTQGTPRASPLIPFLGLRIVDHSESAGRSPWTARRPPLVARARAALPAGPVSHRMRSNAGWPAANRR